MNPQSFPPQGALLSPQARRTLLTMALGGLLVLVIGSLFSPLRVWSNLLVITYYLVTLALGGALFLALTYISGAGWHVAFRRIPEAMASLLPKSGIAILVVLALRMHQYGWQLHAGAPISPPVWC